MSVFQIRFKDRADLSCYLDKIGADRRSLPFFENRAEMKSLFVSGIDWRAANIVKQEMLSRGGDVAVHANVIDGGVKRTDCIIFGTKKQIEFLAEKLETMPWWGLPDTVARIRDALANSEKKFKEFPLTGGRSLDMSGRTLIMGIINLTDDSFFAGSRTGADPEAALERADKLIAEGADLLDLGAESTRPGARRVAEDEEVRRIEGAVSAIRKKHPDIPLSIDTTRLSAAEAAISAGADIINDISGLTFEPELARIAAEHGAAYILMHMKGTPETMNSLCRYDNLMLEIIEFLEDGVKKAESMGLDRSRIIIDPGLGFAKNGEQNLHILNHLESFRTVGMPLLIAASRKRFVGSATETPDANDRADGTAAISALCAWQGVEMVRVHDVLQNRRAVMMADAIKNAGRAL
jgi:dihydropteroate synthase